MSKTKFVSAEYVTSDRGEVIETNMNMARYATDVKELTDYLGLKKFNMTGWSMGAAVMWNYVRLFGCDNLKSLIVIDQTPKLISDETWPLGMGVDKPIDIYGLIDTLGLIALDWDQCCKNFIPACYAKSLDVNSKMVKDDMKRASKENSPRCMLPIFLSIAAENYRDVLPKITVPTLLTMSGDGQLYSLEVAEYNKNNIPNGYTGYFPWMRPCIVYGES